jgi:ribonucleoside-triphosphate reductase
MGTPATGLQILRDTVIYSKYALHLREQQRRETWAEIVERNKGMHLEKYGHVPGMREDLDRAYALVLDFKVMPSMRSLQFGGKKILSNNCRMYNCSFMHIDCVEAFAEVMYLLLCGCGAGYSVQEQHVDKLPAVMPHADREYYLIPDNIAGWADAYKALISGYMGICPIPDFDYTGIRPEGAYIEGSNGKAPGPEPLRRALLAVEDILKSAAGRKLRPLEAHDILCHGSGCVSSGGTRRSAMISLFSSSDEEMFHCKSPLELKYIDGVAHYSPHSPFGPQYDGVYYKPVPGWVDITRHKKTIRGYDTLPFWIEHGYRASSNNSMIELRDKISQERFSEVIRTGLEFGSGEPAIILTDDLEWGVNPCAEISFRSNMFCNLTEMNVGDVSSQEDLNERAWAAAFLGTLQAGYTDFPYIRSIWRERCEEEALLGVGMTGIASGGLRGLDVEEAAIVVRRTNTEVAARIGINPAHRMTCVKPSGTSSCVLMTSSGVHAWYAPYYLRRQLYKKTEAAYAYLHSVVPNLWEDHHKDPSCAYLCIPIAAPEGASTSETETVAEFLDRLRWLHLDWIRPGHRKGTNRHNVSATLSPKEHEHEETINGLWDLHDQYTGVSVFPYDTHGYEQPPFSVITKERYDELAAHVHKVDMSCVIDPDDYVEFEAVAACAGGQCEIVGYS